METKQYYKRQLDGAIDTIREVIILKFFKLPLKNDVLIIRGTSKNLCQANRNIVENSLL